MNFPSRLVAPALLATALVVSLTACSADASHLQASTNSPALGTATRAAVPARLAVGSANSAMPAPGTCHFGSRNGQPLPDPKCTPGAVNPQVTPATLRQTICHSGWTATVRPPTSVTNPMKAASARSYGVPRSARGEYDHLVPLELGGAPADPRNLWFEPGHIPNPKDAVESKLNDAVCSGLVPLRTAQVAIARNWVTAFAAAGLRVAGGHVCLQQDPSRCATSRHRTA